MLFNSLEFAIFLPVVLGLYYCLSHRAQNAMLLAASYLFYGWWDWRFLSLLWISTVLDYFVALAVHRATGRRRKLIISCSLVGNLGILGFFKYYNFFIDSAGNALQAMGFQPHLPVLHIILPVGISFYTFQTLSYALDVYRGKMEPTRDFPTFALYVTYFPQLVAGPIERAGRLLGELNRTRRVDGAMVYSGALLMLLGFFKKMAVADTVAPLVEDIFHHSATASWVVLLKGIWLFAIQIYCDFSGYSDIARGCSRLMGIELMINFNQPYLSANITEFWRRWHISLSTWLRDYLYIPLGGNRLGNFKTYRNLMLTMVLGGLWHGAHWTFVIWGGLHGVYLAIHKWMGSGKNTATSEAATSFWSPLRRVLLVLGTFHLVLFTWIFFRAPSLGVAGQYLAGLFAFRGGLAAINLRDVVYIAFFALLVLLVDWPQHRKQEHTALLAWPWPARGLAMAAMLFLLLVMGENNDTPFIYFQF